MKMKFLHSAIAAAAAFATLCCTSAAEVDALPDDIAPVSFSASGEGASWDTVTKSLLEAPDIETRISCITLAAYDSEGNLSAAEYFSPAATAYPLNLKTSETYEVCAFVNMGDLTQSVPSLREDLVNYSWSVPSYQEIDSRGLPMYGKLTGFRPDRDKGTAIALKRLFARVTANLTAEWSGSSIGTVRIRNLNGTLRPEGTSAVSSSDGVHPEHELSSGTGSAGTFVFYVPENRQGSISGISSSADKSPDGNSTLAAKFAASRLTYLEAEVSAAEGDPDHEGKVVYRCILGANATTDMNLVRNCAYIWNLTFTEDGLSQNDWKTDTGELDTFTYAQRLTLSLSEGASLHTGGTTDITATLHTDRYRNGILETASWQSSSVAASSLTFVSSSPGIAKVSSAGRVTAVSEGTATITVTHKSIAGLSATAAVTVQDSVTFGYRLGWGPKSNTVKVGGTFTNTTFLLYTDIYTNGVRTTADQTGTQISLSLGNVTYTTDDASVATVSGGTVTGYGVGTTQVHAVYALSPSQIAGAHSGQSATITTYLNVTVEASVEKTYRLGLSPSGKTIEVGDALAPFSVRLYINEYTVTSLSAPDGTRTTHDITGTELGLTDSHLSWSSSDTSVATISSGTVTGKAPGTATISVQYMLDAAQKKTARQGQTASDPKTSTLTVNSKIQYGYRLGWGPKSNTVKVGGTFTNTTFLLYTDIYTNGVRTTADQTGTQISLSLGNVTYTTDDASVATVSGGTVTGYGVGTTQVHAVYALSPSQIAGAHSGQSATITTYLNVTVEASVEKTYRLGLSPSGKTIEVGDALVPFSVRLYINEYTVTSLSAPDGTRTTHDITGTELSLTDSHLSWSSSDTSVATVSSGTVTGKAPGTATISVQYMLDAAQKKTARQGQTASDPKTSTLTVKDRVRYSYSLAIEPGSITLSQGDTYQFRATLFTTTWTLIWNGTSFVMTRGGTVSSNVTTTATWTSSTAANVSVSSSGKATAKKAGSSSTITASASVPESTSVDGNGSGEGTVRSVSASATVSVRKSSGGIDDGWDDGGHENL